MLLGARQFGYRTYRNRAIDGAPTERERQGIRKLG